MIWRDQLTKGPLDPDKVQRETRAETLDDWIDLLSSFPAELPEPFAKIDVLDGPGAEFCCEALRTLKRNPRPVKLAPVDQTSNRLWNINSVLYDIADLTTPGTALDLGCGAGRDAVWLAANGWEVTAVDRLQENLETLKLLRAAYAPNDPIHWVQANLNETKPQNQSDLVLLHYCWDPNYFELAKHCVRPNGLLSVIAHSETNYKCFANPRESRILKPEELTHEGFVRIIDRQFWSRDRHSVSIVLQRLFSS